ncbi:pyridoxal-phosphate dependent enzyme [Apibacter muscae]|uniref:Pyridoxal-phosphate dependent enzyme n=1 Tax=Apibacter muscae TaxID=2509004 RepID=A0A563DEQ8_9FLAO|nr:pyridoxal-phosphate dependent enzyme [Apibacter muscae]TWP28705.1 pyridoxal-phosphate dependent enzyme [Apibacter muscae]TWP30045.1 pyridoxal-phosphate dependent enzyme [Apibacter muscae]
MAGTYNNVLELINNTPLVRLNKVTEGMKGKFFAKLECYNPGHSTKDRIALHIIENAERKGLLKPGATIVETTSGNTGFSIAMVSIVKGYKCILAVSDKTKPEKISFLRAMGAKVYLCPANVPADDPRSYYEVAKKIAAETPNSIYINQYFNKENTKSHYLTTGPEIWEQTQGKITHLIGCTGTGGTLTGAAEYLKEKNPNIKIIGVDAVGSVLKKYFETGEIDPNEIKPYQIEGLGKNLIPEALDFSVIDKYVKVSDEPSAYATREIALKEAMMVGYTSGASLTATRKIAEDFTDESVVVLIFPDHGSRYMTKVFSDEWMQSQGFVKSRLNGLESHATIETVQ